MTWHGVSSASATDGTMLATDPAFDRSRQDWIMAFYDADRRLIGAAYSTPFTVPEGTVLSFGSVRKADNA